LFKKDLPALIKVNAISLQGLGIAKLLLQMVLQLGFYLFAGPYRYHF